MPLATMHIDQQNVYVFRTFVLVTLLSILASIHFHTFAFFLIPISPLVLGFIIDDYRRLFYLMFAILPFSVEYYFDSSGFGTDLPSEPMMLILTGITTFLLLRNNIKLPLSYVTHPIFIMIWVHVFWIMITGIQSTHVFISMKLLAAKIWYVFPFFILPLIFVKDTQDIQKSYKILYKFLFVAIFIVLVRHAFDNFSFSASYHVVRPFFRNHVTYAAIAVICLPFVWAFMRINALEDQSNRWMKWVFGIFIIGIYFSYTRAAILSMIIAIGAWYIIKRKWVRQALMISSIVATVGIFYLSWNNNYLDLTPDFERTITHTEFDNLLEATYKLEDISSMERVFRWVAGIEMIKDKFWLGFGPGTFYSEYKAYSISRFQTYVSGNPDQSGIHNYFLMTWVEQGFIGFLILIALCFLLLIEGERLYHRASDPKDQLMIMATTLAFIIIFAMCLINDLIETDKVGPFFFFNAAILLFYHRKINKEQYLPD
ncbi:MAG: O-antigen ligase family protein [Saprospiraceae bacterium]